MFEILFAPEVNKETKRLAKFRLQEILEKIKKNLADEPDKESRNRKIIKGLKPPWTETEEFWELRVGEYRVFYDVDREGMKVTVQAIRRKPPDKTTEEIL